ncbi:hypothetical protein CRV24_000385 [Beauveria bassiana]|nr:hypothetical protein CRV24_000385 [Beauveria bassiana]KAH8721082.1 hypothetical protein HC256_001448 [Beauveria bassiana]
MARTESGFIAVDRRGDVTLQVGRDCETRDNFWQPAEFLVCSRTLARASPVFDRMLYGPYIEAMGGNKTDATGWTVALPEDKPAPMQVFLNIAHANFVLVPLILSVDSLYDLAVLTNYYDATPLLLPWIGAWMASLAEISQDANEIQYKMLWIAWEFGRKEEFGAVAHRMLMEQPEQCEEAAGDQVQVPHILDEIESIRAQTISKLLHIVGDVAKKLTVGDQRPRWCRYATHVGHHQCELMSLGSMTFCLARAGLWPLPEAADVKLSLSDLYRILTNLVIHDIGATADAPETDHRFCNPRRMLMDRVDQVMRGIPSPLTEFHVRHLEKQAKRLRQGQGSTK